MGTTENGRRAGAPATEKGGRSAPFLMPARVGVCNARAAMKQSWNFPEGAPIADGRTVLEPLGGGGRYEVFLVHDDRLGAAGGREGAPAGPRGRRAGGQRGPARGHVARAPGPPGSRARARFGPRRRRIHICCWNTSTVANLKDVLEAEAALPVGEALDLAVDLLAAAEHLAGHEVVHLDIKPSNVVMTDPPRLIDLGAARSFAELEARRTPIGTARTWRRSSATRLDPGRPAGGRLGRRHHALPRAHGPAAVLEGRPPRQRAHRPIPPARRGAARRSPTTCRSPSPARSCACSPADPAARPTAAEAARRARRARGRVRRALTLPPGPSMPAGRV